MRKVNKAKVIARAFLKDKSNKPNWHKERLEICETCPLNSKNLPDATVIDKMKPRCSACGCFILEKTSQETEMCGKADIGEEPLWPALKVETSSSSNLDLINLSPDKINVDLNKDYYLVNYGDTKKGSDSLITLQFTSKDSLEPIECKSTCGCTTPAKPKLIDKNTMEISFSVRTTRASRIVSTVTVYYNVNGQRRNVKIKVNAKIVD